MSFCCCGCFSWFEPNDPMRAATSRFLPQSGFICYKMLLSAYFVFWSVFWPVGEDIVIAHKFVTYWTFYVASLYFLTSAITAYMPFGQLNTPTSSAGPVRGTHEMGDLQPLPTCSRFLLGFQIFTWNVACVGSLVVVVVFWFSLYDGGRLTSTDVNAHIIIAVIMAIDQLLVATKFERRQMWASFVYSAVYIIFNIIWFLTAPNDERVIYTTLDWGDDIGQAGLFAFVIIFVLVPLFGLVHYSVFRLREGIHACCGCGESPGYDDVESGKGVTAGKP